MKVDKQAFCRVLAGLWRGLHVMGKVGMGAVGGFDGAARREGMRVQGGDGVLRGRSNTDMQPLVLSSTVCF